MGENISNLEVDRLVPPLLACLSTASVSPQPSPALVQLLSPILQQRLHLLADSANTSEQWLSHLCWEPDQAEKLLKLVERSPWEPHPVSGDIEFILAEPVLFRKWDADTLKARVVLQDSSLEIGYVWCLGSEDAGPEWRLGGLSVADGNPEDISQWHRTLADASSAFDMIVQQDTSRNGEEKEASVVLVDGENNEEDSYWSQYDNAPLSGAATPFNRPPGVAPRSNLQQQESSDDAFYAQYESVQPALDHSSEDTNAGRIEAPEPARRITGRDQDGGPSDLLIAIEQGVEQRDAPQAAGEQPGGHVRSGTATQQGVRDYIRRDLRNLQQLAQSAGIDVDDFKAIVTAEVAILTADN